MIKNIVSALITIFYFCLQANAQSKEVYNLLDKMHKKYAIVWPENVSFIQKTIFFEDGKIQKTSNWYEAIQYPHQFRIDIDSIGDGTITLYTADSVFAFLKGKLKVAKPDNAALTLITGGMFKQDLSQTINDLKKRNYNLNAMFQTKWKGENVFIIGANGPGESVNQFWVDAKNMRVVRIIYQYTKNGQLDFHFDKFKKTSQGGYIATYIQLFQNQKLLQEEIYSNIKTNRTFPDGMFDPKSAPSVIWQP